MDETKLEMVLAAAGVDGDQLGADEMAAVWATLGVEDQDLLDEFVYAVASMARSSTGTTDAALGFRLGKWKLDLATEGVRAGILAAFVAGALAAQGVGAIGIGLATVVVPTVLSIEDIELTPGEQRLLLHLRLRPEVQQRFMTQEQLYESLPPEVRGVVNPFDFADFVERLREAGMAQEARGFVRVTRDGERRPLISWR